MHVRVLVAALRLDEDEKSERVKAPDHDVEFDFLEGKNGKGCLIFRTYVRTMHACMAWDVRSKRDRQRHGILYNERWTRPWLALGNMPPVVGQPGMG